MIKGQEISICSLNLTKVIDLIIYENMVKWRLRCLLFQQILQKQKDIFNGIENMKIFYLAEHIFAGAFFAVAYYLAFSKYRKNVFNAIGMFI